MKGSIEYENNSFQHLGSVVTNHGFSDWATTEIDASVKEDDLAVIYAVHTIVPEQEIREQRHYRNIMNMLGIAYWEWTKESGFYASDKFKRYTLSKRPLDKLKGNQIFDDAIYPEDVDKLREFFAHGDRHEREASVILRMKLLDGSYQWTEIVGFKEYGQNGETLRMSCVMCDVDKKWIDQRHQLEEALTAATLANESKTEFLSRISHDIRTPLNVIIGMDQLALENNNPKDTNECLHKINVASEFLLGLINDVLDLEHIESGKMDIHLTPYSGEEFTHYIESVITPLCEQKNIHFEYSKDDSEDFVIMQDKLRINQIYFNLLSNAVKYTQEGGNIVFHTHLERTMKHTIKMEVSISDTGIGMSKEFQTHMFDPFSQEAHEIKPVSEGNGLGLSIVKKLCDMMDMDISVESELGVGTTFTLHGEYRIADEISKEKQVQDKKNINISLKNKTILVCEDHPLNQEIIQRILEKKGAIVVLADNGKRGVELFEQSVPDSFAAILMDIRMPVMDGLQATKQIRELSRKDAKTVPIIALTANAYDEDIQRCLKAGMNMHLSKPIEPKIMYQTIQKYL